MSRNDYSAVRRKWSAGEAKIKEQRDEDVEVPNEIDPQYEEYLLILQERNRMIKKLKKKDEKTIELERKEQGFSLYVNGANDKLKKQKKGHLTQHIARPKSRKTRTAGDGLTRDTLVPDECGDPLAKDRAKTAPEKNRRKNWVVGSINLKTQRGDKLKIHAPEILTGNYDEDFEDIETSQSYQYESSEESDSSDDSIHDSVLSRSASSEDDFIEDQVTLSIADVKKLRKSLEMNESIRESLANKYNSSPSDSEIPEEDIEEELRSPSPDKMSARKSSSSALKPSDVIVLEFGSSNRNNKESPKLEAKHRKGEVVEEKRHEKRSRSKDEPNAKSHRRSASERSTESKDRHLKSKRKDMKGKEDRMTEAALVAEAMHQENMQVIKKEKRSKGSRSAPGKSQNIAGSPVEAEQRASSASSSWKDRLKATPTSAEPHGWSNIVDPNINKIVEKVLQLDDKGQRRLLRALADLDSGVVTSTKDFGEALVATAKPMKATIPVKNMVKTSDGKSSLEVKVNILSNWGHPERVGLTEIQIFDGRGQKVDIDLGCVYTYNTRHQRGMIANLFNGKCKTVKERHMWSCDMQPGKPVEIKICLASQDPNFSISKLKIWNFNKGLQDLGIGARQIQLSIGGKMVYSDELDKGCGNQVFDYGKTVTLVPGKDRMPNFLTPNIDNVSFDSDSDGHRSPALSSEFTPAKDTPPTRCETRIINRSQDLQFQLPVVDSCDVDSTSLPTKNTAKVRQSLSDKKLTPTKTDESSRPKESKSSNHKKHRKSKMAARLDGSSEDPTMDSQDGVSKSAGVLEKRASIARRHSMRESITPREAIKSQDSGIPPSPRDRHREAKPKSIFSKPTLRRSKSMSQFSKDEQVTPREISRSAESRGSHEKEKNLKSSQERGSSLERSQSFNIMQSPVLRRKPKIKVTPVSPPTSQSNTPEEESKEHPLRNGFKKPKPDIVTPKPVIKRSHSLKAIPAHVLREGSKGNSPSLSEDDTPMIHRLRDIRNENGNETGRPSWLSDTAPQIDKKSSGGMPVWLKASDGENSPNNSRPSSRNKQNDSGILDNWPKSGTDHLLTVLDDSRSPSSSHGRRSRQTHTPEHVADDREDEKYIELAALSEGEQLEDGSSTSRMKQIQSARAQWRQKEQLRLEESWTSLNLFERSHKGRLSIDMEDDILDEYLNTEKSKPSEPTIMEEEEVKSLAESDDFTIPELPLGRELVINIKSTWGDHHYVGLNGIDMFTSTGNMPPIASIRAEPSDINILPEYDKDPRVVANLLDGANRTRDDTHMWLAPFTRGRDHLIYITFQRPVQLAVMRIWNYNKSRIHSYRGAKDLEITLDGSVIFKGEIARACGGIMGGSEAFGDTILFTTDEDILEMVSQYDKTFEADIYADDDDDEDVERPKTADEGAEEGGNQRPYTSAARGARMQVREMEDRAEEPQGEHSVFKGQLLTLNFTDTWGDPFYLGLTGLEVAGSEGEPLPLTMDMLEADPQDLHVLPGYEHDDRTLDKLIDGVNITTSDEHMWLIPYTTGENHTLKIHFPQPTPITAVRFWNYNKSREDTYRGAKTVHISLDSRQLSPPDGFLIRKGPGNCYFDFAQEICFAEIQAQQQLYNTSAMKLTQSLILDEPSQEYETFQMPCGFIYQFHLLSTWGDAYYLGLNGLQFYDKDGNKIELSQNNISAYPDSVNVLEGVENDVRTPEKLINDINDTQDGSQMWLAPILPNIINRVYVIFDTPVEVSMIKLWNYSKTPNRGVKDFALLVDDLLVYNGTLSMVTPTARGILPTVSASQPYHTVLFTNNKEIRRKEKHTIINNRTMEQDVQMCNDHKIVSKYSDPRTAQSGKPVDQAKRPTTSVTRGGRQR